MKTYLIVWFSSEGGKVTEITDRLMSMGFKPVQGAYDYVYEWGEKARVEQSLAIGDQVKATLRDLKVSFKLHTVDH